LIVRDAVPAMSVLSPNRTAYDVSSVSSFSLVVNRVTHYATAAYQVACADHYDVSSFFVAVSGYCKSSVSVAHVW
jgi:hypothetical protein